jgi:hypothetical protein
MDQDRLDRAESDWVRIGLNRVGLDRIGLTGLSWIDWIELGWLGRVDWVG